MVTFFSFSIYEIIKKFDEFSKISVGQTPYALKSKEIIVTNTRTLNIDTIRFHNVQVINFWASWCKPCIEEQPSLEKLLKLKKNLKVVQVSFDSINRQQKILNKYGWSIPAYFIEDTSIFRVPIMLPKTYILKDTIVVKEIYGAKNWTDSSIINFIDSLTN